MPLEMSVSDATIWSITLESSNTIQEASFTLIHDVYSTGVTYDNCQLTIAICLSSRSQDVFSMLPLLKCLNVSIEHTLYNTKAKP
jgi:hypothetical protein